MSLVDLIGASKPDLALESLEWSEERAGRWVSGLVFHWHLSVPLQTPSPAGLRAHGLPAHTQASRQCCPGRRRASGLTHRTDSTAIGKRVDIKEFKIGGLVLFCIAGNTSSLML